MTALALAILTLAVIGGAGLVASLAVQLYRFGIAWITGTEEWF